MFTKSAVEFIVDRCVLSTINPEFGEGGFTIWAESGKNYTGHDYLVGGRMPALALSLNLGLHRVYNEVAEWYRRAYVLSGDEAIVGGWVNEGTLFIDLITTCDDEQMAQFLGNLWDQFSVGHFDSTGTFNELEVVK